jgi:hypothetical protein
MSAPTTFPEGAGHSRRDQAVDPCARSDIHDFLAGTDLVHGEGIARARKGFDGFLRNSRKQVIRIAQNLRQTPTGVEVEALGRVAGDFRILFADLTT